MLITGHILNASNAFLTVTNFTGLTGETTGTKSVPWLPLGTVGASATGELGLKVIQVGASANSSTTAATTSQGQKAVTTANTPVLLVATPTLVESVEIYARKSPTVANTGNIYVGVSSTGGQNFRVLEPGQTLTLSAPAGKKLDLNTIYIDSATNADAVTYTAVN